MLRLKNDLTAVPAGIRDGDLHFNTTVQMFRAQQSGLNLVMTTQTSTVNMQKFHRVHGAGTATITVFNTLGVVSFAAGADQTDFYQAIANSFYTRGTANLKLRWCPSTTQAGTNTAVWRVALNSERNTDVIPSPGPEVLGSDVLATMGLNEPAGTIHETTLLVVTAAQMANLANLSCRIEMRGLSGSHSMGGTGLVLSVLIRYE